MLKICIIFWIQLAILRAVKSSSLNWLSDRWKSKLHRLSRIDLYIGCTVTIGELRVSFELNFSHKARRSVRKADRMSIKGKRNLSVVARNVADGFYYSGRILFSWHMIAKCNFISTFKPVIRSNDMQRDRVVSTSDLKSQYRWSGLSAKPAHDFSLFILIS